MWDLEILQYFVFIAAWGTPDSQLYLLVLVSIIVHKKDTHAKIKSHEYTKDCVFTKFRSHENKCLTVFKSNCDFDAEDRSGKT